MPTPIFIPLIIPSTGAKLTVSSAMVLGIGVPLAAVAGAYAAHKVSQNPKAISAIKMVAAAALISPLLAAEDLLRAAGVKVPAKGIFYNDEDKSIWQIWNESEPAWNRNI